MELYMLKQEGQGDEGNFISGEIPEIEEIQAVRAGDWMRRPNPAHQVSAEVP
jgi:hypothetical protein